jgi:UPF0755 protein
MRYTSRPPRRQLPRRLLIIAGILILLLVGATVVVRKAYFDQLKPVAVAGSSKVVTITVEQGATVDQIAQQLKDAGLIRSTWAFRLYVSSRDVREALEAGTYEFDSRQNVPDIVSQLTHGRVATDLVTIVPGQRLDQIRTTLINYGFKPADVDSALSPASHAGHRALVDKPAGASLEGYIYPDSYQKNSSTTPKEIIARALDEMDGYLTPDLRASFAKQGLSIHEALTLASVVEKEVSPQADRDQAAQVFLKRLSIHMALESNATEHYFDSYKHPGLPPTPISNVTVSSLKAVAKPAQTDWLYFVSGDDGVTHFSRTLAEHEAAVEQYCKKLC